MKQTRSNSAMNRKLHQRYGIDVDTYNRMREAQQYRCAICDTHETEVKLGKSKTSDTALQVDHCHDTMAVRLLLCTHCNTMLGKAKDNPAILRSGAVYLEHFKETT